MISKRNILLFFLFAFSSLPAQTPVEIFCFSGKSQYPISQAQITITQLSNQQEVQGAETRPDGYFHTCLASNRSYILSIQKTGYKPVTDTIHTELHLYQFVAALEDASVWKTELPEANNQVVLPRIEPEKAGQTLLPELMVPQKVERKPRKGYVVVLADLLTPIPDDAILYQAIPDLETGRCSGDNYIYYCAFYKRKQATVRYWKKHMQSVYPGSWVGKLKNGVLVHP